MPDPEVLVRPAAELAREKTLASIQAEKQRKNSPLQNRREYKDQCEAVRNMPTFENEVHNTSPNASNIVGGA